MYIVHFHFSAQILMYVIYLEAFSNDERMCSEGSNSWYGGANREIYMYIVGTSGHFFSFKQVEIFYHWL